MSWTARRLPPLGVNNWPTSWPKYGTDEWYDLDTRDPRKKAALFEAAESWRLQQLHEQWLDSLDDADWYAYTFRDARAEASKLVAALGRIRSFREVRDARAKPRPVHQLKAASGWPPIAIPGRPGWRRHLINGRQVDRPHMQQEKAA